MGARFHRHKSKQTCFKFLILLVLCTEIEGKLSQSDLPVIVWWSDMFYPHLEKREEIACSLGDCVVTKNKYRKQNNEFIAFMFYGTDFKGENLPLPRKNNHMWALLHEESPMNNYIFSHNVGIQLFNYTSTFSRHSDFPLTTQFIPSLKYLGARRPVPLSKKNKLRQEGTAPILYLQSHCHVASDRDRYVRELMKYIPIDSYGACLHNKDLQPELLSTETYENETLLDFISQYKFHLSFENAICNDYITEKLFRSLHVGSVPVYKGSPSVRDWMPSHPSVIVADEFKTPQELSAFILELDQNDDMYEEYLKFKEPGGITNVLLRTALDQRTWDVHDVNKVDFIQGFECYVCDKLHNVEHDNTAVANKNHMGCVQPHVSLTAGVDPQDEWFQEGWIENYWYAYDEARAIELMIRNNENNSSNFLHYCLKFKYQH